MAFAQYDDFIDILISAQSTGETKVPKRTKKVPKRRTWILFYNFKVFTKNYFVFFFSSILSEVLYFINFYYRVTGNRVYPYFFSDFCSAAQVPVTLIIQF